MRIALALIALSLLIIATAWGYWFFATPIIYQAPSREAEALPSVLLDTPTRTPTDLTPQD